MGFWGWVVKASKPGDLGAADEISRLVEDPKYRERQEKVYGKKAVKDAIDRAASEAFPRK